MRGKEDGPVWVETSDGVRLCTYVRLPEGDGPWPVLFARSPYPHMLPFWMETADFWTAQGYAFVYQECRGTGGSEGEWTPFVHERQDGLDSLRWIAHQPWCNGNIGTYGAFYSGVVQWCMADALPPEAKTMFIAVTGIERHRQSYMNGMFRHDIYTVWALGNSGAVASEPREGLYGKALSIRPHADMDVRLFGRELPWYRDWITQVGADEPYWREGFWAELRDVPKRTEVPVLMTAGWFDHNLDASIASFGKLPEKTRSVSLLLIGPWIHTQSVFGDLDYPGHDVHGPGQRTAALAWFDHHLKGKAYPGRKGIVQAYVIGEKVWREWDGGFGSSGRKRYYLAPAPEEGSPPGSAGRLTAAPVGEEKRVKFAYDPERPVPTRGGAALMAYLTGEAGAARPASVFQPEQGERADVLTFLSDPLERDLAIAGSIRARLTVSTEAEDTAFTVTVMEVSPDGRAINIRDGITSLRYRNGAGTPQPYVPNEKTEVEIELWPMAWKMRKGSRIRVDVSSSNFPAYHAHPNLAGPWALQAETRIARQTVYGGTAEAAWLDLPITDGEEDRP